MEHIRRRLLAGGLDWDSLLQLAGEHKVQGMLAIRLKEAEFAGVPACAREELQSRMRVQHLFNLSMMAELFRVLQDFSQAHIETILLKGPQISLRAYGDPAVRSYVDLDLLVRHRDILRATQHMLALGFDSDVPESAIRAGKIPGEYVFKRPGTQRIVELHTERTSRYYPKPMRVEELFARKTVSLLDGRKVLALSLEDELVMDCIHGAKDFWERLTWVSDVASLIVRHSEIDWEKVRRAAADVGGERMLRVGVLLGALLFGVELPTAMAEEIRRDRTSESLCRQILRWLPYAGYALPSLRRRAMFRMEMADGGISGAAYLMRLSLSPTEEDWEEGAEERRPWLWDAVRRPFRLLRKYGSAYRSK
ncbi:MAG: nucleotidyltransferase family protein [Candidatus Acidiferrum sp.]